jgi:VanZ family protein
MIIREIQAAKILRNMKIMTRILIWCKPFSKYLLVAWVLIIISISSVPSLPTLKIHTSGSDIRLDYLIHVIEYGFLAVMAFLTFADTQFRLEYRKFFLIAICLILFALADEYHQKFIPGRTFNTKDIWSNIGGISGALVFCMVIFKSITKIIR